MLSVQIMRFLILIKHSQIALRLSQRLESFLEDRRIVKWKGAERVPPMRTAAAEAGHTPHHHSAELPGTLALLPLRMMQRQFLVALQKTVGGAGTEKVPGLGLCGTGTVSHTG